MSFSKQPSWDFSRIWIDIDFKPKDKGMNFPTLQTATMIN